MMDEMTRAGLRWPELTAQNVVDLLIYIRSLPESRSQFATFQPGEPELGRVVFDRNCSACHSLNGKQDRKIDLLDRPGPRTLTDYVAAMWNHAPEMKRHTGQALPVLQPGDMTHLVGYLFDQHYFYEKGDVTRGGRVYREKNCVTCHETRRPETGAPDLTQANERFSPVTMTAAIWKHGPTMLEMMRSEQMAWPEFHGSEMTNLIAYLNSRLVRRIAPVPPGE
jgi:mono/diheme cytochrome c family protein